MITTAQLKQFHLIFPRGNKMFPDPGVPPALAAPGRSGRDWKCPGRYQGPRTARLPFPAKPSLLTPLPAPGSHGCCGTSNPSLQPFMPWILQHIFWLELLRPRRRWHIRVPQGLGMPWGGTGAAVAPGPGQGTIPAPFFPGRVGHRLPGSLTICSSAAAERFKGSYTFVMT